MWISTNFEKLTTLKVTITSRNSASNLRNGILSSENTLRIRSPQNSKLAPRKSKSNFDFGTDGENERLGFRVAVVRPGIIALSPPHGRYHERVALSWFPATVFRRVCEDEAVLLGRSCSCRAERVCGGGCVTERTGVWGGGQGQRGSPHYFSHT